VAEALWVRQLVETVVNSLEEWGSMYFVDRVESIRGSLSKANADEAAMPDRKNTLDSNILLAMPLENARVDQERSKIGRYSHPL